MPDPSKPITSLVESLRAARAERGGRSRRNEQQQQHGGPKARDKDLVVQQTDIDAGGSRLSAVDLGYLDDPFARPLSATPQAVRRMPIINRGTYVRTVAIDRLVGDFLDRYADEKKQIISLGAGTDTRPFRLFQQRPALNETLQYQEFDFPATTSKKITAVERTPSILSLIQTPDHQLHISPDRTACHSASYVLQPLDLRVLAGSDAPELPHVSPSKPTLILSECCLTYLDARSSNSILKHFTNIITAPMTILLYEPIRPNDAFGRTMISNLASRSIEMPSLTAFPDLAQHEARLKECGFDSAESVTIRHAWDNWVSAEEKERLRGCEMVDEEEEWNLLAEHYAVIWGRREGTVGEM